MAVDPRESEARGRAAARAGWPIARFRLGDEPPEDLVSHTTPAERIAMMWELAGGPWPTYDRRNIPARIFRPGTPRPVDDDA